MALFGQASDDAMLNKVSPLSAGGSGGREDGDGAERDSKRRRLVWTGLLLLLNAQSYVSVPEYLGVRFEVSFVQFKARL